MDNIDISNSNVSNSHYYRLPTEIVETYKDSPLFTQQLPVSTGYRTGITKHIGYFVKSLYEKDYFVKYCVSGTGWFEVEHKRHIISSGDLILCERNTLHQYGTSTEDPWSAYWVYFRCNYMEALFPKLSEQHHLIVNLGPDTTIIRYFTDILHKKSYGYALPYLFHASQTLGLILAYINLRLTTEIENTSNKYSAIITYMNNNLDKTLNNNQLAQLMGLSNDHFIKVFHSCYGYTPMDYFIRLKMQKACNYLVTTNWPIKTIALNLGYEDTYYFSRIFKKKIGFSPKNYRLNYH